MFEKIAVDTERNRFTAHIHVRIIEAKEKNKIKTKGKKGGK